MPLADDSWEDGLGTMLVDSHTHLLRLEVSPESAVRSAAEAGVVAVVNVGTGVEDSQRGAELAAVLPNVYSTAGIHPHNAGTYTAADLEALAELSESPGIVALGEVGLDYYRSEWSGEVQQALFEDVISLANDTRLPLVIHSREAFADTMACLGSARVPIVLHCFEGGDGARLLRRPRRQRHVQGQRDGQGAPPDRRGTHPPRDGRPLPEPPARARQEERAGKRRPHGRLRRREARDGRRGTGHPHHP